MKSGIVRIVVVNIICLGLICWSPVRFFLPKNNVIKAAQTQSEEITIDKKEKNTSGSVNSKESESSQKTETQEKTTSSATSSKSSSSSEAKQTSAKAYKGKIISQYNSPYTAALSYDGVYVKNNTNLKINLKDFVTSKIGFTIKKNNDPQVLILHTHATESFMTEDSGYYTEDFKSRTTNNEKNMVSIGKIVTEKLEKGGIKTIHSTTQHDNPSYTQSYSRAANTICYYLKKYPSIKVVLDLHRDAVSGANGGKVKLVTQINNKKAAQIMLVMGSQSGSVTNFPKWKENFKLAVKLQQIIEKDYPTLARPIMLASKNYNESLTTGSMLIEFGTDANTLAEAQYSASLVGNSIVKLLNSLS